MNCIDYGASLLTYRIMWHFEIFGETDPIKGN